MISEKTNENLHNALYEVVAEACGGSINEKDKNYIDEYIDDYIIGIIEYLTLQFGE